MKRYSVLTLVVLVAGLGLGRLHAQEDGGLNKKIEDRLARLEEFVGRQRSWERGRLARQSNTLKNLTQCLISMEGKDFPRLKDGSIDAYALVPAGIVEVHTAILIMRDERRDITLSAEEIRKGDYSRFPFARAGRWCKPRGRAPLFWEMEPDRDGRLMVAFNTGAVKYIEHQELKRMLAELKKE